MMAGRTCIAGLVFGCVLLGACAQSPPERFEYRALHMGTEARIALYARDSAHARTAARAAFARVGELDAALSDFRVDGALAELATAAGQKPVPVGDDLLHVLTLALDLARETDGAFDPTAGALSVLWRAARRSGRLPLATDIDAARARVGWRHVVIDTVARTVRLTTPGTRLDLGAIAKGYAVDEALAVLRDHGVARALVSLGGEIGASGPPPGTEGWRVALEDDGGAPDTVRLANAAISISGDMEQFLEIDGVRYSHVIDPRTGMPLTHRVAATVIAPASVTADGYATAVTVLDSVARAVFIAAHPEATFRVRHASAGERVPH
jgi:FAD:protein FMN transferase